MFKAYTCPDCGVADWSPMVCHTPNQFPYKAVYYVGVKCECGWLSRKTVYFETRLEAEEALKKC